MKLIIVFLIVAITVVCVISTSSIINIGLTVDSKTLHDALVLISSIQNSVNNINAVHFYILACGKDTNLAKSVSSSLLIFLKSCYGDDNILLINESVSAEEIEKMPNHLFYIKSFTYPIGSGFHQQLQREKRYHAQGHGGHTDYGADMARFYFPSVFPFLDRILFLDTHTVVTCCLEEIYSSNLKPKDAVFGVVTDHTSRNVLTHFHRDYNISHPMVISNIRKTPSSSQSSKTLAPIIDDEISEVFPRYPNDGVLLINIPMFNQLNLLSKFNDVLLLNAREHILNVNTLHLFVLLTHKYWSELNHRANLRHYPTESQDIMSWFSYHGVIHYTGSRKPKFSCLHKWMPNTIEHVHSYTPWLINSARLNFQCNNIIKTIGQNMSQIVHVTPSTTTHDHDMVHHTITTMQKISECEKNHLYHLNDIHSFISHIRRQVQELRGGHANIFLKLTHYDSNINISQSSPTGSHITTAVDMTTTDYIYQLESNLTAFGLTTRIIGQDYGKVIPTSQTTSSRTSSRTSQSELNTVDGEHGMYINRMKKSVCDGSSDIMADCEHINQHTKINNKINNKNNDNKIDENIILLDTLIEPMSHNPIDTSIIQHNNHFLDNLASKHTSTGEKCLPILEVLKHNIHNLNHHAVVGIVIDYDISPSFPRICPTTTSSSSTKSDHSSAMLDSFSATSMAALRRIDFYTFRPSFILIRHYDFQIDSESSLSSSSSSLKKKCEQRQDFSLKQRIKASRKLLERNGYMVNSIIVTHCACPCSSSSKDSSNTQTNNTPLNRKCAYVWGWISNKFEFRDV